MSYDFLKVAIFFDKKVQTFENNTIFRAEHTINDITFIDRSNILITVLFKTNLF